MPTRAHRTILKAAARGELPQSIDEQSDFDVHLVKELVESGLLKAVDASSFDGPAFLNPTITVAGREYLRGSSGSGLQKWAAYATIGAFLIALVSLVSLPWWDSDQKIRKADPEIEIGTEPAPAPDPGADVLPSEITRMFDVSETNSDHKAIGTNTKSYSRRFQADEGYTITSYEWQESSATRVSDFVVNITEGGQAIAMDFKLKCGPVTDRYRGWLRGKLVTHQRLEGDA